MNGDKAFLMREHHDPKKLQYQSLHGIYVITSKEYVVIHQTRHGSDSDKHSLTT